MKINRLVSFFIVIACSLVLFSCTKNRSRFLEDSTADGLSVFSDKGFNIMSCYINGNAYKTNNRTSYYGLGSRTDYELYVRKRVTDTAELLVFSWGSIELVLIKDTFSIDDFLDLQNQRIQIDGTNGYFRVNGEQGTGIVYFHQAVFIPSLTGGGTGHLSGLFECSTPSITVSRGRFDHSLEPDNFNFF